MSSWYHSVMPASRRGQDNKVGPFIPGVKAQGFLARLL
jgi:hypothetical protein